MRGAPRRRIDGDRGWWSLVALLGLLALVVTACSNQVDGSPKAVDIPTLSATQSVSQSFLNFGEAGTVHFDSPSHAPITSVAAEAANTVIQTMIRFRAVRISTHDMIARRQAS